MASSRVILLALLPCLATARMAYAGMLPNAGSFGYGRNGLGHAKPSGGGVLNNFGADFKHNGLTWNEALCLTDSDGDGLTNGMELGDPCCMWRVGEMRPMEFQGFKKGLDPWSDADGKHASEYGISHPGLKDDVSGRPVPAGFTTQGMLAKLAGESVPKAKRAIFVQEGFVCPTFVETQEELSLFRTIYKGGAARMILMLFNIALYVFLLTRASGGIKDFAVRWSVTSRVCVVVSSFAFTEISSGLMHLVADNPAFNEVPFFGSLARGFQAHHDDPSGIARLGWVDFLTKIDAGMVLLCVIACSIYFSNWLCGKELTCRGVKTVVAFAWVTEPMMYLMMATHRWTHCPPADVPWIVGVLQDWEILLPIDTHNVHHADYTRNFPLLSGCSAPLFNWVSRVLLSPKSTWWMGVYVLFTLGWPPSMYFVPRYFMRTTSKGATTDDTVHATPAQSTSLLSVNRSDRRRKSAFALHPIFMGFGCTALMSEGLLAYHFDPKDEPSQVDTETQSWKQISKLNSRIWHRQVQSSAAVCMLVALVGVLKPKVGAGASLMPSSTHGYLGVLVFVAVAVQVTVGVLKLLNPTANSHKWHGKFGEMLYMGVVICAAVGVAEAFGINLSSAFTMCLFALVRQHFLRRAERSAGHTRSPAPPAQRWGKQAPQTQD